MFKNRKVEIKVVNTKKNPTEPLQEVTFETKARVISAAVHHVVYQIGKAMIAYVAVDTIRKVMIEQAKSVKPR